MSYPAGLTLITVTYTGTDLSGAPLSGSVAFAPSVELTDTASGQVIGDAPVIAELSEQGSFSVELPCTDNAGLTPAAWSYTVTIEIDGSGYTRFPFTCDLPSTLGASVTLEQIAEDALTPPPSNSYVSEV